MLSQYELLNPCVPSPSLETACSCIQVHSPCSHFPLVLSLHVHTYRLCCLNKAGHVCMLSCNNASLICSICSSSTATCSVFDIAVHHLLACSGFLSAGSLAAILTAAIAFVLVAIFAQCLSTGHLSQQLYICTMIIWRLLEVSREFTSHVTHAGLGVWTLV